MKHPSATVVLLPVLALVLVALGAACGADETGEESSSQPPAPEPTVQSTPAPTPEATAGPDPSPQPGSGADAGGPAREQLDWFVAALNASAPPSPAELDARFAPAFLAVVPPDQLVAGAAEMTAAMAPPITIESVTPAGDDGLALDAVLVSADGDARLAVSLVVGAVEPHLIEGLVGRPDVVLEFPVGLTADDLDATLAGLAAESGLGVYDVTAGECVVLHEIRADRPVALGSVFKLWLLAELADQVAAGDAAWDETVRVEDRLKSSPGGEVFAMAPGTEISLEELAMAMISISDNSATDHLLARLGRENVEAVLDRIGVVDAAANVPMLSTQALFQLKFVAEAPNADDWRGLDQAGRRTLLAEIDDAVLPWVADPESIDLINADGVPIDQPRDLDLGWFATPADLCRTLTYLADQAERPGLEPVATILEANAGEGLPFDRDRWPTIRFKGGSEPGVVAGAWWFEGVDGRRYVVAGGLADPDTPVSEIDGALALASAITLVE
ncbi:MAG: serine hydrolase [Acidimicrobiales bacterium]